MPPRFHLLVAVVFGTGLLLPGAAASAADPGLPPAQAAVMNAALKIARETDNSAAIAHLERQGDDKQVAANYSQIVRNLYFKEKDVPRMIVFARAGMHFCLSRSRKLKNDDKAAALVFRGTAKTIAYNLGANTWPGWQDKGITIGPAELAIGLDAAKTNLRLGLELKRDDKIIGNAHWLIGAQLLAAGQYAESGKAFTASARHFRKAKHPAFVLMAEGYVALSRLAAAPAKTTLAQQLDAAIAALAKHPSKDAAAFARQLKSVRPVFVKGER